MKYYVFAGIIVVLIIITIVIALLSDKSYFEPFKKNKRHTLPVWGIVLAMGGLIYFVRINNGISATLLTWVYLSLFTIIGVFNRHYLVKKRQFTLPESLPYLFLLTGGSCVLLFTIGWLLEVPFFRTTEGIADNLALLSVFALLPYSIDVAHHYWQLIPVVKEELVAWQFPSSVPPLLENGACSINFKVPVKKGQSVQQLIPIRVMSRYSLGEVFHRAVYEYNVLRKTPRPIEIAANNRKDQIYTWHFYLEGHSHLGQRRYIDPNASLEQLGLKKGGTIYAHRSKKQ